MEQELSVLKAAVPRLSEVLSSHPRTSLSPLPRFLSQISTHFNQVSGVFLHLLNRYDCAVASKMLDFTLKIRSGLY